VGDNKENILFLVLISIVRNNITDVQVQTTKYSLQCNSSTYAHIHSRKFLKITSRYLPPRDGEFSAFIHHHNSGKNGQFNLSTELPSINKGIGIMSTFNAYHKISFLCLLLNPGNGINLSKSWT